MGFAFLSGRGWVWKAVSIPKPTNKKRLGSCNISGPLFIFTSRFDLFVPHPLTLLLIGGQLWLESLNICV